MLIDAALVREQGVTFAVIVVKSNTLQASNRDEVAASFSRHWQGAPVVLMAQDYRGRPTYYGRPDIVRFLANVPFQRLPWRKWTLS